MKLHTVLTSVLLAVQADAGRPTCAENHICADAGLAGACCPTLDGITLSCCDSQCLRNNKCAALGLEGACCPTADGTTLDCCEKDTSVLIEHHDHAQCMKHKQCKGLSGDCCPTTDGVMLDCCKGGGGKGGGMAEHNATEIAFF